jgi:hypothetical protein
MSGALGLGGPTRPYKAKISLGKDSKDYAYYIRKALQHHSRQGGG